MLIIEGFPEWIWGPAGLNCGFICWVMLCLVSLCPLLKTHRDGVVITFWLLEVGLLASEALEVSPSSDHQWLYNKASPALNSDQVQAQSSIEVVNIWNKKIYYRRCFVVFIPVVNQPNVYFMFFAPTEKCKHLNLGLHAERLETELTECLKSKLKDLEADSTTCKEVRLNSLLCCCLFWARLPKKRGLKKKKNTICYIQLHAGVVKQRRGVNVKWISDIKWPNVVKGNYS